MRIMTPTETKELLLRCRLSTKVMAKTFFPDHFSRAFSKPHDIIFDMLDRPKRAWQSKVAIAAPRGIGKTSIAAIAFAARQLLFGLSRYMIYVNASQDAAIEQTENLKLELTTNELIAEFFGNIKTDAFSKERWDGQVADMPRFRVLPAGPGQKIRGRKSQSARPDLIIVDDLENDENVESEEQRRKLHHWFNTALLNTVDKAKNWRVALIGTILNEQSLLANITQRNIAPENRKHIGWDSVVISICDERYKSLFPEYMSDEAIMREVEEHRAAGTLDMFAQEMMNNPQAAETASFKREMFRSYVEADAKLHLRLDLKTMVLIDPARTISAGACFTAISVVSVDVASGEIFVREVTSGRFTPAELYECSLAKCKEVGARILGVEVTGLNEFIIQPLTTLVMQEKLFWLELVWVKPRDKKEKRAGALLPYYKKGLVWHNANGTCKVYEDRLCEWPRPAGWDEIDATVQLLPVLEAQGIHCLSPDFDPVTEDERRYQEDLQQDDLDYSRWLKDPFGMEVYL